MTLRLMRAIGLVALMVFGLANARPAQAQLGVAAGLNYDSFDDLDLGSVQASVDNSSGYHLGLFFDLGAGPVSLRPGVFYRNAGNIRYEFDSTGEVADQVEEFDLSMIEVPIDLRLRLTSPLITPYLAAGPVLRFASSNDEEYDENLENLSVGANVGAGLELWLPGIGLTLYPEIRYGFGITRFLKEDFEFAGSTFSAEEGTKMNSLMLRLGVSF